MKLNEFKRLVDGMSRRAKRRGIDPEVMLIVMPTFPSVSTIKPTIVSTMDDDIDPATLGGKDVVFISELKEFGPLPGDVIESIDRREAKK